MEKPLTSYQQAVRERIHAICLDRNLDPTSPAITEADCRIDRHLRELVELAQAAGPDAPGTFEAAVEGRICRACGGLDALGTCAAREQAACCLYRYLPLLYDAIRYV